MTKQRKTIRITMDGKFPRRGSISFEGKITPQTMAKVLETVAEERMLSQNSAAQARRKAKKLRRV